MDVRGCGSRASSAERPIPSFDIDAGRINKLHESHDQTREVGTKDMGTAVHLSYDSQLEEIAGCRVFIVTVTTVDLDKQPNPPLLRKTSKTVGRVLKRGDIVIYKSIVYPSATDENRPSPLTAGASFLFRNDNSPRRHWTSRE